ncbi:hypothetical protein [Caulobacter hibisci]|uniref:Uncharacterized protein n=1 Tax=Caulobacter hibisci TaxID=2035993 RepID=A0ABS0SZ92_9CAUL|nr:hypothetical protein [Caulobacter hibisci]MBI1684948.1 hypothetical protein [Caulobacter hibisci]
MSFVLPVPDADADRNRAALVRRILGTGLALSLLAALAYTIFDFVRFERAMGALPPAKGTALEPARAQAAQRWAVVKPILVARMKQSRPLELGGVWMMRTGRVCGVVNGKTSFGGFTGMTRFYTDGDTPVFLYDDRGGFRQTWHQCDRDRWAVIHPGSDETGFCATKFGATRCRIVRVQARTMPR